MQQYAGQSSHIDTPQTLNTGAIIGGRFEVLQLLRRDFAGTVYSARDSQSQRDVECLLISLPTEETHQLLELRAHIHEAKQLRLKSFASTYGIGKQGGDGYVVRQRIEGRPLTDHLNHRSQNHRPFKQRGLCSLLVEVIQALEALRAQDVDIHEHGLLRPNVIMIQNQEKPRIRMSDVGLGLLRPTLVKNAEYDPWCRGCIPELRGEKPPIDSDLYTLGALLFQMTQLRPFSKSWLRELSVPPAFPQLPDIIEACTVEQPMITLTDLKSELKYAAQSQVESGGLTRDLSQLQERLQQIIQYETPTPSGPPLHQPERLERERSQAVIDPILAGEESVSVSFNRLPSVDEGAEIADDQGLFLTPVPTNILMSDDTERLVQVDLKRHLVTPPHDLAEEDALSEFDKMNEQLNFQGLVDPMHSLLEAGEGLLESVTEKMPILSSETEKMPTYSPEEPLPRAVEVNGEREQLEAIPYSEEELQVDMSGLNSMFEGVDDELQTAKLPVQVNQIDPSGLDEVIETLHGVEMEELGDEKEEFEALRHMYSSPDQFDLGTNRQLEIPQPAVIPPPPPQSFDQIDDDLNGQRWIVVRDGIDYGPYTLDELSHQLFREEIGLETEICDIETDQRAALGEFTSLDHVLNEWAKERLERKRLKAERTLIRKRRRRIMAVVLLIMIGAITFGAVTYGPELKEAMLPKPARIDLSTWLSATPPEMKALEQLKISPAQRAARAQLARAEKARQETLRDAKEMAREAREAQEASSVDFSSSGTKQPPFSRDDFDKAISTRSQALMNCITSEHQRFPDRSVLRITMTVQQSGRFLNARLVDGSDPGVKCVFRAIKGLKMQAFSGGDKTITLPYQVK